MTSPSCGPVHGRVSTDSTPVSSDGWSKHSPVRSTTYGMCDSVGSRSPRASAVPAAEPALALFVSAPPRLS